MSLKGVAWQIGLGVVFIAIALGIQFVLAAIGFPLLISVQFLSYALTGPGVVGTIIMAWGVGYAIPIIVKQAERLSNRQQPS